MMNEPTKYEFANCEGLSKRPNCKTFEMTQNALILTSYIFIMESVASFVLGKSNGSLFVVLALVTILIWTFRESKVVSKAENPLKKE